MHASQRELGGEIPIERKIELVPVSEWDGNTAKYTVVDGNGKELGDLSIGVSNEDPNDLVVVSINIDKERTGENLNKKYGLLIYQKILEIAKRIGKRFTTSYSESTNSLRVWESLRKKNLAKKDPTKEEYDSGLYYADKRS